MNNHVSLSSFTRWFLDRSRWTPLLIVWLTHSTIVIAEEEPRQSLPRRPNVLMIAIDDQNDWIEPLGGHPLVKTPQLKSLAERGTVFLNAHCQAPLCNPSRTSLLLGLRSTTTGIYGLSPWFRDVPALSGRLTLPQAFHKAGYTTLTTGKIFHGGGGKPKDRLKEFDEWGPAGGVGKRPEKRLIQPPPHSNPLVDWGAFPHLDSEKGDTQITDWAIEKLKQRQAQLSSSTGETKPFLMCVGYFLPHVPCYVTPEWLAMYPDDDSILPMISDDDRKDTPRFSWYLHWRLPEPRLNWLQQHGHWRSLVRSYLASTSYVDAQIGRLLAALEATGEANNTLIVLWSDHGWHLGEKGITGKNTLWERSTRVPLLFAGPGVLAGGKCVEPVELLDIYPTLAQLCQLEAPTDLEGVSLVPQLTNPLAVRQRPAITSHNQGNHAIRTRDHRYIRYADGSEELYDHLVDPHELKNLADDPAHSGLKKQLNSWLPSIDQPPVTGSKDRVLTFDRQTNRAIWEGEIIERSSPIPE